jgi:hypothetical protein
MSMFQAFYNGDSKSLNLIVLATIVLFTHLGMWLLIERTRARIERSTKIIFQRGLVLMFSVAGTVLSLSYLYPNISYSIGFQVTVSVLLISVVIHTLTKLIQNGIEGTSGYIAGAGGFFVVLLILPALFISDVPEVVVYGVLGVSMIFISAALLGAYITWKDRSRQNVDSLAAFRARRMIKVLLCSTSLAAFILACIPFMLYVTPIESITTVFCSSLVCMSGVHVATERVGFLVEYAQEQIPLLKTIQPHELEDVARRTIDSARMLTPSHVHPEFQNRRVLTSLREIPSIHATDTTEQRAIIERIIAHQKVEKEIFSALMRVSEPGSEYITFDDFSELLLPHIHFSNSMVGENVVGISEESMQTIAQVISAAKSATPVIFCGEQGVGKNYFASLLGKIRGVATENIHTILDSDSDVLSQIAELTNQDPVKANRRMIIVKLDSSRTLDSAATLVRRIIASFSHLDIAILIHRRASELPHLSIASRDSIIVPEVIEISPLRNRPQDSVCQAIWFLFNEAHALLGEVGVKRLRIKNSALLEALTYKWPSNSRELKDSIKAALYFARRESEFDIHSIIPFLNVGDSFVTAPWLRDGIERYFLDFSSDDASEVKLATQVGIQKHFAKRIIQATRRSEVMTA